MYAYANHQPFYFYPSFVEIMKAMPPEKQDEFLTAIISYGSDGTYSISDPIVEACFAQCKASIDSSKERNRKSREAGKLGGRPREIDRDFVIRMRKKGYSAKEIAEMANCHVRSVQRIIWLDTYALEDLIFEKRRQYKLRPLNHARIDYYTEKKKVIDPLYPFG